MSQAPHMPLFVDAYLADTTHLSTEEHGAYLLLLMAMWRRGGTVPNDDRDNARMTGLSVAKWKRFKVRFADFLIIDENGISQKRLQKEWIFVSEKRNKNAQNGALGGRPKSKENKDLAKANGSENNNPNESPHTHTHKEYQPNGWLSETSDPQKSHYSKNFDLFWTGYPTDNLMSKKSAFRVWNRMKPENHVAAIKSLPAFKAHCNSNPDYRPVHANKYLSEERFVGFNEGQEAAAESMAGKVFIKNDDPRWPALKDHYRKQTGKPLNVNSWPFPEAWLTEIPAKRAAS